MVQLRDNGQIIKRMDVHLLGMETGCKNTTWMQGSCAGLVIRLFGRHGIVFLLAIANQISSFGPTGKTTFVRHVKKDQCDL